MNTMTDLVTLNCRRLAVAWGYPDDLQPHWRLGYCQGDGVCYYGRITPSEIPRLVEGMKARGRLDERTASVLNRLAATERLDITLRHTGRYTHSGCTDIITDDVPGYARDLQVRFETVLREDFDSLCDEAESEGYSLLDARWPYPYFQGDDRKASLLCRRTGHLTVQAEITGYDDAEMFFIDDELAYNCLILPALEQDVRFPQVRFSVTVPVQRDRDGFWTHPLYDQLWREGGDITTEECSAVLVAEHLEWTLVWRDDLARGPDGGFTDLSAWEPERPEGDGWFIASIHETADGVVCVWLRSTICAAA